MEVGVGLASGVNVAVEAGGVALGWDVQVAEGVSKKSEVSLASRVCAARDMTASGSSCFACGKLHAARIKALTSNNTNRRLFLSIGFSLFNKDILHLFYLLSSPFDFTSMVKFSSSGICGSPIKI
jgi:hypothetical protein